MLILKKEINEKNREKLIKKFNSDLLEIVRKFYRSSILIMNDLINLETSELLEIKNYDIVSTKYNLKPLKYYKILEELEKLNYNKLVEISHYSKFFSNIIKDLISESELAEYQYTLQLFNDLEIKLSEIYKKKNIYDILNNRWISINKDINSIRLYYEDLISQTQTEENK